MRSCDEITPSVSLKIANLVILHRSLALNMIFFKNSMRSSISKLCIGHWSLSRTCRNTSCTRLSTISLAFLKNWWGSICLEFITALINIRFSKAVSIARYLSLALYPAPACTKRSHIESFKLSSHAIWATNDCLIPINNGGSLIWLRSSNDSMNSSHRCSHAIYSSRVFNRTACSRKSRSVCSISIRC